jgi:hypothetical protein
MKLLWNFNVTLGLMLLIYKNWHGFVSNSSLPAYDESNSNMLGGFGNLAMEQLINIGNPSVRQFYIIESISIRYFITSLSSNFGHSHTKFTLHQLFHHLSFFFKTVTVVLQIRKIIVHLSYIFLLNFIIPLQLLSLSLSSTPFKIIKEYLIK